MNNNSRHDNWLQRIKANDESLLMQIYTAQFRKVEQYIVVNSGSADDAREIYQEAFIAMWRNIQLDKAELRDESALAGYLFSIARNKWLDELRKRKRTKTVQLGDEHEEEQEEPGDGSEQAAYLNSVKKQFTKLGDQCQDLLKRFYFKKESMREIGAAFGWTEASAKNNKYRCLQRLREMITQDNV